MLQQEEDNKKALDMWRPEELIEVEEKEEETSSFFEVLSKDFPCDPLFVNNKCYKHGAGMAYSILQWVINNEENNELPSSLVNEKLLLMNTRITTSTSSKKLH